MTRLKGLKAQLQEPQAAPASDPQPLSGTGRPTAPSRAGKVTVIGHFSPELRKALKRLAADETTSVQALMGEAFDLLFRARNMHPFGER